MKSQVISIKTWIKRNPEIEDDIEASSTRCLDCDGEGWIECHECGHEAKCESCNGSGIIKTNTVEKAYYKQVDKDRANWEKYVNAA